MSGTPITITADEARRSLVQDMTPAVRDMMRVRLVGLAQYVTGGGGVTLAIKSRGLKSVSVVPPTEQWDVDGDDILADIDLHSHELESIFRWVSQKGTRTFVMTVEVNAPKRMLASGDFIIRNNPYYADGTSEVHPAPSVAERLQALLDTLAELQHLFSEHSHDGGDTQTVDHAHLTGHGELTHEDIDAALETGAPVNGRIQNAVTSHDENPAAHSEQFNALAEGLAAHERSDVSEGNNVHGFLAYIDGFRMTLDEILDGIRLSVAAHVNDQDNPHNVTVTQIGAVSAEAFAVFQEKAVTGVSIGGVLQPKADGIVNLPAYPDISYFYILRSAFADLVPDENQTVGAAMAQLAEVVRRLKKAPAGPAPLPDPALYVLRSDFEDLAPDEDQTLGGTLSQLAGIIARLKKAPPGEAPPLTPALYAFRPDFNGLVPSEDLTVGEMNTQLAEIIRRIQGNT